jgi:hypothetical protein
MLLVHRLHFARAGVGLCSLRRERDRAYFSFSSAASQSLKSGGRCLYSCVVHGTRFLPPVHLRNQIELSLPASSALGLKPSLAIK